MTVSFKIKRFDQTLFLFKFYFKLHPGTPKFAFKLKRRSFYIIFLSLILYQLGGKIRRSFKRF